MPSHPYSETFVRATAGGVYSYWVPPGKRAIVRSVTVMNFVAPPVAVYVAIAGVFIAYLEFQVVASFRSAEYYAVAYSGQEIQVQVGASGMHTTVSGTLLTDTGAVLERPVDAVKRSEALCGPGEPVAL